MRQKLGVAVSNRLAVDNVGTMLGACVSGHGVAQLLALGIEDLIRGHDKIGATAVDLHSLLRLVD
jgi:hypothetical protein